MPTDVSALFQQLGLRQWWGYPTQFFGTNGELGTDFGMGGTGLPVGAITGGQVIYVDAPYANDPNHSSLGYVVQVLSPDGYVYHYQHLKSPGVHVGDVIQAGSVVGTSGGCAVGNYGAVGAPCLGGNQDAWSTGQHIEVRRAPYKAGTSTWEFAWANPYQAFLQLAGGSPEAGASTTYAGGSPGGGSPSTSSSSGGLNIAGWAEKAGIFVGALVLIGFGAYMLFKNQVDSKLHMGAKVAEKAVLL